MRHLTDHPYTVYSTADGAIGEPHTRRAANGPGGALAAAQLRAPAHSAVGTRAAGRRAGESRAATTCPLRSGLSVSDGEQSVLSPLGGRHCRVARLQRALCRLYLEAR